MGARPLDLRFTVSDPEAWARRILQAQSSPAPPAAPAEAKLEAALRDGIHERGRYVATLADLSFPQAFWHPEALDDILPTIAGVFDRLGASAALGADFYATLALAVEIRYGPGDDVDAIESAERREQITRIMRAANAALAAAGHPKRFHNFTEDLPDWDFDEPVWLFLTDAQRASLLRLDILRPLPTPAPAGHSG
jgi:hypothetical protein